MGGSGTGKRVEVTLKLPQLQNLCKRDPSGYKEDFEAQVRRLESELGILALQPATEPSARLIELIQFAAAVSSSSYKTTHADHIANLLIGLLVGEQSAEDKNNVMISSSLPVTALHRDVRKTCVSALILMRNKGVLPPIRILELFFRIMAVVPDKKLRELLYHHLVNDIRNINKKGKRDDTINRSIQTFLHKLISGHQGPASGDEESSTDVAAKRATDLVCELYRRRIWTEERTVAIVASAVLSPNVTIMCRAMRFFLNIEEKMAEDDAAEEEVDWSEKNAIDYHSHSKKTAARERHVNRQLKNKVKAQKKREMQDEWMEMNMNPDKDKGVEACKKLYPAIELLRDPQGLAEAVFKKLRSNNSAYKYQVKLLMINFVTRLVGNHELILLPLYSFLQKYMGGHQRDVTAILAYAVQACHENVPPDEIHGILKTIAHNFITERCSEEQMAVGINAARAICTRVPSSLSTEEVDGITNSTTMDIEAFARDLAAFGNHRDRSVAIAGKGWLNFVRDVYPGLLQGKNRGLKGSALHKAGAKPLRYGEKKVASGVEGAELLYEYEAKKAAKQKKQAQNEEDDGSEGNDDDDDVSGEWQDVEDASDVDEDDEAEEEVDDDEAPTLVNLDAEEEQEEDGEEDSAVPDVSKMTPKERELLKQKVSSERIFTASDFEKMRKLVELERRAREDPREAARRKRAKARGRDLEDLSDDSEDEDEANRIKIAGAVNPEDIMADARRKRQSKAERLEKVIAGRTKFEAKQREGGSTNEEKKRKKNFTMSKFSFEARSKGRGKKGLNQNNQGGMKRGKKQIGHEAKKRRRKS
ncbi:protein SDA1 [Fistulifera solaris]|uniref:Protein SDA1 n=1 Tax=Fistulifera solaris TaxID=1519565 RepID=A0A1Z5KCA6_FISSO|nr:protein SDA1 [Fistulifera solaris]|eukprot:GAX23899.1 protein SDA1 [Fistulifera solaris]